MMVPAYLPKELWILIFSFDATYLEYFRENCLNKSLETQLFRTFENSLKNRILNYLNYILISGIQFEWSNEFVLFYSLSRINFNKLDIIFHYSNGIYKFKIIPKCVYYSFDIKSVNYWDGFACLDNYYYENIVECNLFRLKKHFENATEKKIPDCLILENIDDIYASAIHLFMLF